MYVCHSHTIMWSHLSHRHARKQQTALAEKYTAVATGNTPTKHQFLVSLKKITTPRLKTDQVSHISLTAWTGEIYRVPPSAMAADRRQIRAQNYGQEG